jgi:membrane protein required for colicin V production
MLVTETYNLIDGFIIVALCITTILGVWKGFARTLAAAASLVLGSVLAVKYYGQVQPYLGKISSLDPHVSMVLSMVIIFMGIQILFVIVRKILDALIDVTRLNWLDRTLGASVGLAGGFVVAAVAVHVAAAGFAEWPVVKQSQLMGPVSKLSRTLLNYAPQEAKQTVQAAIDKWKGNQASYRARPPHPAVSSRHQGTGTTKPTM